MTTESSQSRRKEIEAAATASDRDWHSFIRGAEWADKNPSEDFFSPRSAEVKTIFDLRNQLAIRDRTIERYEKFLYVYSLRKQGGISGQAFTSFKCLKCESEDTHCNTNTPLFCRGCTKILRELLKQKERE